MTAPPQPSHKSLTLGLQRTCVLIAYCDFDYHILMVWERRSKEMWNAGESHQSLTEVTHPNRAPNKPQGCSWPQVTPNQGEVTQIPRGEGKVTDQRGADTHNQPQHLPREEMELFPELDSPGLFSHWLLSCLLPKQLLSESQNPPGSTTRDRKSHPRLCVRQDSHKSCISYSPLCKASL